MKNITLNADQNLIELARKKARTNKTSLNSAFRQWLQHYVGKNKVKQDYHALMKELSYAKAGRHFSRDEMNER